VTSPFLGSERFTRQQLRSKRYERLSRDVYVLRDAVLNLRLRTEAARLVLPDGIPCLRTAALLQKLPVDDDGAVHLARGRTAARSERAGIQVHRLAIEPDELFDLGGLAVTDGPRTFADLSRELDLEALVALGDVVVRRWGEQAVAKAVARSGRRPGVVLLRQAAALLDPRSDSPAETRARLRLHAAGFTRLRHGVVVTDAHGGWLGQPDLADALARVALQHEGEVHFLKGVKQRRKDIDRDEVVREQDWQVVSSTALDDAQPERLIRKITAAYQRSARLWGSHVLPPHMR
jgi:hypothetical protein